MLTLITTLSIIVHCISIFAIIILYLRQNQYKDTERKMEKLRRDIDDIFQAYMVEMKEENKEIADALESLKNGKPITKEPVVSKEIDTIHIKETNEKVLPEIQTNILVKPSKHAVANAYKTNKQLKAKDVVYKPPYEAVKDKLSIAEVDIAHEISEQQNPGSTFQQALLAQVDKHKPNKEKKTTEELILEMNSEGCGIEEIAKKLNKGKTEIELLLKFHAKSKL
ncbi:hypothetical protein [Bacillus massiliigorillae]|uniref:hypothetical protein n=1 Tax=Bacillus massiliigorillae TaxID=1243664 RepID=UPI0003A8D712|nr:hypothetical protein [Bacillus massiliigorillae]